MAAVKFVVLRNHRESTRKNEYGIKIFGAICCFTIHYDMIAPFGSLDQTDIACYVVCWHLALRYLIYQMSVLSFITFVPIMKHEHDA
jgi:hypothetical protein